jgi:hypothetical protein
VKLKKGDLVVRQSGKYAIYLKLDFIHPDDDRYNEHWIFIQGIGKTQVYEDEIRKRSTG